MAKVVNFVGDAYVAGEKNRKKEEARYYISQRAY